MLPPHTHTPSPHPHLQSIKVANPRFRCFLTSPTMLGGRLVPEVVEDEEEAAGGAMQGGGAAGDTGSSEDDDDVRVAPPTHTPPKSNAPHCPLLRALSTHSYQSKT